jgi:hypothetical protein
VRSRMEMCEEVNCNVARSSSYKTSDLIGREADVTYHASMESPPVAVGNVLNPSEADNN